jgi:hypothetical protein
MIITIIIMIIRIRNNYVNNVSIMRNPPDKGGRGLANPLNKPATNRGTKPPHPYTNNLELP